MCVTAQQYDSKPKTIGWHQQTVKIMEKLTARQQDVFIEMCKGKSNKEIARTLNIAEATVKLHLTTVFKELGVQSRSQAIIQTKSPDKRKLTPLEILEEFATVALTTPNDTWPTKVVKFGQAIQKRSF